VKLIFRKDDLNRLFRFLCVVCTKTRPGAAAQFAAAEGVNDKN